MDKPSVFAELRRRNVLRAGALYIAAVWALAQGIAQLGAFVGLPDWAVRWFLVAAAVGFPFWVAFTWFYELTPTGLKRESDITPEESLTQHTGRKFDYWIIGILAIAVVLLVTNTFVLRRDATSVAEKSDARTIAAQLAKVPEKSVAVLPFANESGDPKQQYFSDGLSEELITELTQIASLKVIGKYSSFQFRDSSDSPAHIGAALGVAHLIEGSVRQAGQQLRITVTLIRASDGSSVWSEHFDRPLKDVFAIQDEIGKSVAAALRIKLGNNALVDRQKPPGGSVETYQLMLQGRSQARRGTQADFEQGIALLERAVQLDPDYAYAWAVMANNRINLGMDFLGGDARQLAFDKARSELDHASALAPDMAIVHSTRGYLLLQVDHDPASALTESERALELAPHDGSAMVYLAVSQPNTRQQQAVNLIRRAIATDPLRADWYQNLSNRLIQLGRFEEAEQAVRKSVALQPRNPVYLGWLSTVLAARGQFDGAEQAAREAVTLQPDDPANALDLAWIQGVRGHTLDAMRTVRQALTLQPDYPGAHMYLTTFEIQRGNPVAALREAEHETDPDYKAYAVALAKQAGSDRAAANAALADYIDRFGSSQEPQYWFIADLYAVRKEADEVFKWLRRGVNQHDYATISNLLQDSLLFAYHHDPRFTALCRELGLPVPGQTLVAHATTAAP